MLNFLYKTVIGRVFLKVLTHPVISRMCGAFCDCRISKILIGPFVRANGIDLSQYYSSHFRSFNECFARKIKPYLRPFDTDPTAFLSPCDGRLSVYEITSGTVIPVKQSRYSIARLLHSRKTAARFEGGYCLVFRLCVDNYHRYCYFDSGIKGENHFIEGKLHTVQPVALEDIPVFTENCREYTVMKTDNFGPVIQMEVGAMLVGKISNHHGRYAFSRGEEKGCFLYGGSTIILLIQKDRAVLDDKILRASAAGKETPVIAGELIGRKYRKTIPLPQKDPEKGSGKRNPKGSTEREIRKRNWKKSSDKEPRKRTR
ncbi:MAG: phosphatidylserine decarboxylase [Lachnospiraceae bacterium]|nr:phosphatidylserine decarboxylase [Lachnospiraceae bacterium]